MDSKEIKLIKSSVKKEFDDLVNEALESGFDLDEYKYDEKQKVYIQKIILSDCSEDYENDNKSLDYCPTFHIFKMRNGCNHGLFIEIRKEDGIELQRGYYQGGKKYGQFKYISFDDETLEEIEYTNYRDDLKDGEYQLIRNNKLFKLGYYKENVRIGNWKEYDEEGEVHSIEETEYDGTGHAKYQRYLIDGNKKILISEGQKSIRSNSSYDDNYYSHGKCIEYYIKGYKKHECTYSYGESVGEELIYYENNILKCKRHHTDNHLDGSYEEYYKNGKIKFKGCFKYNSYQEYEPRLSQQDIDDMDTREAVTYEEGYTAYHKIDEVYKIGKWLWYNESGEIIKEKEFKKGEIWEQYDDTDLTNDQYFIQYIDILFGEFK